MLALTEDAVAAIRTIVASSGMPEGAGLRITREVGTDEAGKRRTDLRLSLVESPQQGDEVLEDVHVYIDPEAVELLSDRLLDADMVGEDLRFSLDYQA